MKRLTPLIALCVVALIVAISGIFMILYGMFHTDGKNHVQQAQEIPELSTPVSMIASMEQSKQAVTTVTTPDIWEGFGTNVPNDWQNGYDTGYRQGLEAGIRAGQVRDAEEGTPGAKTVTVSGSFSACVRQIIPDYVRDGETPACAVLTLFQDSPFCFPLTPEQCAALEPGEVYTFELEPSAEIEINSSYLGTDGWLDPDFIRIHPFQIANIRPPEDGEVGLDCCNLHWTES